MKARAAVADLDEEASHLGVDVPVFVMQDRLEAIAPYDDYEGADYRTLAEELVARGAEETVR